MVKTANETVAPLKTNKTNKNKKTVAAAEVISRATRRSTRITKRPERYSPVPSGAVFFQTITVQANTTQPIHGRTLHRSILRILFPLHALHPLKANSMASFLSASNEHSATNSSSFYSPSNSGNSDGSSTYNEIESTADS